MCSVCACLQLSCRWFGEEGDLHDAVTAEYPPFNLNSDPSDCPHGLMGRDSFLVLFLEV